MRMKRPLAFFEENTRPNVAYVCIPLGSAAVFRIRKVGTKKGLFIVDYCRS